MQDRIEAFKIFGLPEDAGRNEIESRYFQLVKKYKYLPHDEQPSIGEPIFAVINQAYRLLIGYTPMQKIQFKELTWREKLQHIREYYLMQIAVSVVSIMIIFGITLFILDINKAMHAAPTSSNVSTTQADPLSNINCKCPQKELR